MLAQQVPVHVWIKMISGGPYWVCADQSDLGVHLGVGATAAANSTHRPHGRLAGPVPGGRRSAGSNPDEEHAPYGARSSKLSNSKTAESSASWSPIVKHAIPLVS